MEKRDTLGGRIQTGRKAAGLSQEALGERLGVSRQAVSKWEADAAVPELEKQIEEAYRSLDDRIVRLCGRRPYAEDLFSARKRQSEAREGDRKHAPHLPRLPPKQQSSGGMKPAF
ncbi:helix-turn-helix transcriptional regulator [uncultured Oscillibacter sp.]|uniref:helix-turn-helix transcriptional regulator n=1 Tax=uncultured Oscillibacter sp. TaxID=876091 RepID=UPI0025E73F2C|nr:helix-turn-helix transcriptional regulator [uncultured Oscillibacter sp.]